MITHKQYPNHHIFETEIGGRTFTVETGRSLSSATPKQSAATETLSSSLPRLHRPCPSPASTISR